MHRVQPAALRCLPVGRAHCQTIRPAMMAARQEPPARRRTTQRQPALSDAEGPQPAAPPKKAASLASRLPPEIWAAAALAGGGGAAILAATAGLPSCCWGPAMLAEWENLAGSTPELAGGLVAWATLRRLQQVGGVSAAGDDAQDDVPSEQEQSR